jgi:hypothetical protein
MERVDGDGVVVDARLGVGVGPEMDGVAYTDLGIGGVDSEGWNHVEREFIDTVAPFVGNETVVINALVVEAFASEIVGLDVANGGFGFDCIDRREIEYDLVDRVATGGADEAIGVDAWLGEHLTSEVVGVASTDEDVLGEMIVAIGTEVEGVDFGALALLEGVEILTRLGDIATIEVVVVAFADGFFDIDMFFETDDIEGLLLELEAIATAEIGTEGDGVVAITRIDHG